MEQNANPQPPVYGPSQQQPPIMGYQQPQMGFTEAIKTCLIDKYCCFTGRARRSEYWNWTLAQLLISVALSFVLSLIFFSASSTDPLSLTPARIGSMVLSLVLLLPNMGATVRRLHDTGRSGWWVMGPLVFYVPMLVAIAMLQDGNFNPVAAGLSLMVVLLAMLALSILLIIWLCQDSDPQPNKYGPSPKYQ